MIASLSGTLKALGAESVLIDVGGIGFTVFVSTRTLAAMPAIGEPVELRTYFSVSESAMALFGFRDEEEKALFERLILVHGIGPKGALGALSALSPAELARAIMNEDVAALTRIPGVGKKTASRIVVELKGSLAETLESWPDLFEGADVAPAAAPASDGRAEAASALRSMGFTDDEIALALKGAPEDADEVALIQYALKRLGS